MPKFTLHSIDQAILDATSCRGPVKSLPCFNVPRMIEGLLDPMLMQL